MSHYTPARSIVSNPGWLSRLAVLVPGAALLLLTGLRPSHLAASDFLVVSFDDSPVVNRTLIGEYPAGVVNWGTGTWFIGRPTGQFKSKNLQFTNNVKKGSFTFVAPRRVVSIDAYNLGGAAAIVSLSCSGQTTVSVTIAASAVRTLATGWTTNCSPVTISSGNGWNMVFDSLVTDGAGGALAPVATNDFYNVGESQLLTVAAADGVLANDQPGTSGALTAVLVTSVTSGTLTLSPDGSFSYAPTASFAGTDSFTYKAKDSGGESTVATVSIMVASRAGVWWIPPANTSWDWQLDSPINPAANVAMYDIDMFNNDASVIASLHAQGRKVFCYVDVGSWENWRPDAAAFPESVKGTVYGGFPDERWLDVRAWNILGPIMTARLTLARSKGCDGIEPDNVDGYDNTAHEGSGFPLTYNDQIVYNLQIADLAHSLGMSVGLKNDINQAAALQPAFDWALSEQCFQYGECDYFTPFVQAGKAVFEVEYKLAPSAFCSAANARNFNALLKHNRLDAYRVACR